MRRTLILLAVVAGVIAACGGSAATNAPQAPGTPAAATQAVPTPDSAAQTPAGATDTLAAGAPTTLDACQLITADEAAAALGGEPVDAGVVPEQGAHSCLFSGNPASGISLDGVEISITSGSDFNPNQKSISGLTITPVSGVGDAAYYVSIGTGYQVLNVRKGQTTFTVSVLQSSASDSQLQAAEKTLAMAVLGRI